MNRYISRHIENLDVADLQQKLAYIKEFKGAYPQLFKMKQPSLDINERMSKSIQKAKLENDEKIVNVEKDMKIAR